jgi:hypothetical protein
MKEPFDVRKPRIKKTYSYLPLDIYPYNAAPIRLAESIDNGHSTFILKNVNDIVIGKNNKATIYTAFLINEGNERSMNFNMLKKSYDDFMNVSTNTLTFYEFKEPPVPTKIPVNNVSIKPFNKAILNSSMFADFINFTGVTNSIVRAWIAELLDLVTIKDGVSMMVSVCIYNDIPDVVDPAFPPYFYIQRIANFPFIR